VGPTLSIDNEIAKISPFFDPQATPFDQTNLGMATRYRGIG
jgi:hypothetical protein